MKRFILIFALICLAGAAGFYVYKTYFSAAIDVWQLVPGNAVLVYENSNAVANWNEVVETPLWTSLSTVDKLGQFEHTLESLDSLTGRDGALDRLFRNNPFLASVHVTSATTFDLVLYLDIAQNQNQARLDLANLLSSLTDTKGYRHSSRSFQGTEIHELRAQKSRHTFSYIQYKGYVVGAFTPFLVEDVIRHINGKFRGGFAERILDLQNLSKLENDDGNIYIDNGQLPDLLSVFLRPSTADDQWGPGKLADKMYMDIKVTDQALLFNGVATTTAAANQYLNAFARQEAARVALGRILPQQTAYCYSINFSDFDALQNDLMNYWEATDRDQLEQTLDFEEQYTFQTDWIGEEAGVAVMEPIAADQRTALVFIAHTDSTLAMNRLMDLAEQRALRTNDTVFSEQYGQHRIVQLTYPEFPQRLFGRPFEGFENCYFTPFGRYVVFGNSMQATRLFVDDVQQEDIWGKSVRQINFLENTLSESSINLFVNTPRCWSIISQSLNSDWAEVFSRYRRQFTALDMIALQVSNLERRFYTSLAIGHTEALKMEFGQSRFDKQQIAYALSPITTKPTIVRNHNNNRFEVMLQDSLHYLYLISNEGEILWADSLGTGIVTDIYQVDYYKNNKLQYLFASEDRLFLLDRNGDFVARYPMRIPGDAPVQFLNVVDYDNTKRYRFMVANTRGDIFLFDKEKNNLEGWTPRETGGSLSSAPFHIRIKGGDCIVALRRDGVLSVINRRGHDYPGFPLDLNRPTRSPLFVRPGNDFESTTLTTISSSGQLIQANLRGKVIRREQLYRASAESLFRLVPDVLEKDYILVRQDFNTLTFIDQEGMVLFEKNFVTSGQLLVQYYNFGSENKIYVVVDEEQEFTYIYNKSGDLVNYEPLESGHPVALIYSSDSRKFSLYKTYFNRFSMYEFE